MHTEECDPANTLYVVKAVSIATRANPAQSGPDNRLELDVILIFHFSRPGAMLLKHTRREIFFLRI